MVYTKIPVGVPFSADKLDKENRLKSCFDHTISTFFRDFNYDIEHSI